MTNQSEAVGVTGTLTSMSMLLLSLLPHLTATVQFLTAVVGLIVAILTAIYMSRKLKGQNEKQD
jgi:uncharacterized membrane protein YgaE (UPF0421/DUF939 family)